MTLIRSLGAVLALIGLITGWWWAVFAAIGCLALTTPDALHWPRRHRRMPAEAPRLVESGLPPGDRHLTVAQQNQLIAAFKRAQQAGHSHALVHGDPPAVVWQGGPHGDAVAWMPRADDPPVTAQDLARLCNEIAARYGGRSVQGPDWAAHERAVGRYNQAQTQDQRDAAVAASERALRPAVSAEWEAGRYAAAGLPVPATIADAASRESRVRFTATAADCEASEAQSRIVHGPVCDHSGTVPVTTAGGNLLGFVCGGCWQTVRCHDDLLARSLWPEQWQVAQASAELARKLAA